VKLSVAFEGAFRLSCFLFRQTLKASSDVEIYDVRFSACLFVPLMQMKSVELYAF
jgi:hypothetical protein